MFSFADDSTIIVEGHRFCNLNRKQFVQLDTFKSKVLNSPQTFVMQGEKLSGLLYHLFLKTYLNLNCSVVKDTSHLTVQFVRQPNCINNNL